MATCKVCKSELVPGSRWCGVCHTNVLDPSVGKLASPGKRLLAYLLDILIPVIAIIIISAAGSGGDAGIGIGLLLAIAYIIWAFILFTRGTTPGKKVLGMYVVKENGKHAGFFRMLFRETIGKYVSGLILSLGWIWILIDKERQGWHDKLASTFVIG